MGLKNKAKTEKNSEDKQVLRAIAALFSTNVFGSIVGVIGSIIQGYFVTAEELGFFKQFNVVSGYLFFLHFGVFHAVERLYPLYMGKNEPEKAKAVIEIGNAWILLVCIPISTIFVILSIISFILGEWKVGLCWIVQFVAIWTSMYGGFLAATYRSGKEFESMAKANVLNPILSAAALPLYWIAPFGAMTIRNCTSAVSTLRLHFSRPVKVKWRFNFKELWGLIKQGFPLFFASYITTTGLDSIRSTLILIFLLKQDLGYWSFAYTIILLVLQLPTSVTAVYAPKVISEYARTNDVNTAYKLSLKPIKIGAIFMAAVVPIGVLAIKFLIPIMMPNYVGAIPLSYFLLFSVPFKLTDIFGTVLNALGKIKQLNIISIASAAVQVGIATLGAYLKWGIVAFGIGFLSGFVVKGIGLWLTVLYYKKKDGKTHDDKINGQRLKDGSDSNQEIVEERVASLMEGDAAVSQVSGEEP